MNDDGTALVALLVAVLYGVAIGVAATILIWWLW